jgi:hypothetical protein
MSQRRITSILACSLALGCSNLADENTSPPPLAQMVGTLTLADGATVPEEQLLMTLLWETEVSANLGNQAIPPGQCYASSQFLELEPQAIELDGTFPNAFTLDIVEPPPPDALLPVEGEGTPKISAYGTLVIYADGDGDGMLDGRSEGEPSPDRVLATTNFERWDSYDEDEPTLQKIGYLSEPHSFPPGPFQTEGFNLPAGFTISRHNTIARTSEVVPIDTPLQLNLSGAAHLQDMLCDRLCGATVDIECPASPRELPAPPSDAVEFSGAYGQGFGWPEPGDGRHVTVDEVCEPGGRYMWRRVTCEGCTCGTELCSYEQADVAAPDWPCAD